MSQIDTSTSLPAQPAAPVATPAPVAPAQPAGDDGFVRVSRDQLSEYKGDFHAALADANSFRELGDHGALAAEFKAQGWGVDDIRLVANQINQQRQTEGSAPQPAPGVTQDEIQKMLADNNKQTLAMMSDALTKQATTTQQAAERRIVISDGHRLKHESGVEFLKNLDMELTTTDADGKETENPHAKSLYFSHQDALLVAQQSHMPENLTPEQQELFYASPTPEDCAAAKETMAWANDVRYEHAASVATEQETTPSATLGSGPAGKQTPPDWDNMSEDQRIEATKEGS